MICLWLVITLPDFIHFFQCSVVCQKYWMHNLPARQKIRQRNLCIYECTLYNVHIQNFGQQMEILDENMTIFYCRLSKRGLFMFRSMWYLRALTLVVCLFCLISVSLLPMHTWWDGRFNFSIIKYAYTFVNFQINKRNQKNANQVIHGKSQTFILQTYKRPTGLGTCS